MEIDELARHAARLGDEVSGVAAVLQRSDPGPVPFGADASGCLGELGRALYGRYGAALAAREHEAAAAGARLTDLAGALRTAASGYRDVEDGSQRRHQSTGGT
jgi:hypothetical protein